MPNYQRDILVKLSRLISLQWAKIFPLLLFVDTFLASSPFYGVRHIVAFFASSNVTKKAEEKFVGPFSCVNVYLKQHFVLSLSRVPM